MGNWLFGSYVTNEDMMKKALKDIDKTVRKLQYDADDALRDYNRCINRAKNALRKGQANIAKLHCGDAANKTSIAMAYMAAKQRIERDIPMMKLASAQSSIAHLIAVVARCTIRQSAKISVEQYQAIAARLNINLLEYGMKMEAMGTALDTVREGADDELEEHDVDDSVGDPAKRGISIFEQLQDELTHEFQENGVDLMNAPVVLASHHQPSAPPEEEI